MAGVEEVERERLVCVTGASGYIGSWLVKRLLEQGYSVNATVRDPGDIKSVEHLRSLPEGATRLKLYRADLYDENAFDEPLQNCHGVFHVACPVNFNGSASEEEVVGLSLRGTMNLLRACKRVETVTRVIITSSVAAVICPDEVPPSDVVDESYWTSVDYCRRTRMVGWMYFIAKTQAEQLAIRFGEENGLEVISILPGVTVGPAICSKVPPSVATLMALAKGDEVFASYTPRLPYVHINDLARAYIFLYECPDAGGRYICSLEDVEIERIAHLLSERCPDLHIPIRIDNLQKDYMRPCVDSGKLKGLGFDFKFTIEMIVDDAVALYRERELL